MAKFRVGDIVRNIRGVQWNSGSFESRRVQRLYENSVKMDLGIIRELDKPPLTEDEDQVYLIEISPGEFTSKDDTQLALNEDVKRGQAFLKQFKPQINNTYDIFS